MSIWTLYVIMSVTLMGMVTATADGSQLTFVRLLKLGVFWPLYVIVAFAVIQRYGPYRAADERSIKEFLDESIGTGTLRKIMDMVF